jgi:hypothetical protein
MAARWRDTETEKQALSRGYHQYAVHTGNDRAANGPKEHGADTAI